jgi:hypothetical protein
MMGGRIAFLLLNVLNVSDVRQSVSAKAKKTLIYAFTPLYIFMASA